MKNHYDVIIVGASIAGLEAAKRLGGTGLKVLILDKNENVGSKPCAHGVTLNDIEFIAPEFLNFPCKKAIIHYRKNKSFFPKNVGFISSIDRREFLREALKEVKRHKNIDVIFKVSAEKIGEEVVVNGENISFKYLIGADGSNSIVRKYLKLPVEKIEFAIQYITPEIYKDFEIFLGDDRFGSGYAWIFPNKSFTSIGCGSDTRAISPRKIRTNFEDWLKEQNIKIANARLEMSIINYDYRGYRFGNVFLVGDAAGLASGFTGKGMYAAFASAKQVVDEILGIKQDSNIILEWVSKKRAQERVVSLLKYRVSRRATLFLGLKILPRVEERILKYL